MNARGTGVRKIEMNFLPDVYVLCEVARETVQPGDARYLYKGKSISEVLE